VDKVTVSLGNYLQKLLLIIVFVLIKYEKYFKIIAQVLFVFWCVI